MKQKKKTKMESFWLWYKKLENKQNLFFCPRDENSFLALFQLLNNEVVICYLLLLNSKKRLPEKKTNKEERVRLYFVSKLFFFLSNCCQPTMRKEHKERLHQRD